MVKTKKRIHWTIDRELLPRLDQLTQTLELRSNSETVNELLKLALNLPSTTERLRELILAEVS